MNALLKSGAGADAPNGVSRRELMTGLGFLALAGVAGGLMTGCRSMREASEDASKCEAAIQSELGLESVISFRVFAGTGGKRLFVSVHLLTAPAADMATVKAEVEAIVRRSFRYPVTALEVAV